MERQFYNPYGYAGYVNPNYLYNPYGAYTPYPFHTQHLGPSGPPQYVPFHGAGGFSGAGGFHGGGAFTGAGGFAGGHR